jgi:hypothetical protein
VTGTAIAPQWLVRNLLLVRHHRLMDLSDFLAYKPTLVIGVSKNKSLVKNLLCCSESAVATTIILGK